MAHKLPSHPDCLTEDRLSVCENYSDQLEVPQWLFIKKLLQHPVRNVEDLVELISHNQYDLDAHTLKYVFQLPTVDNDIFFNLTYPSMVRVGLRMPELFPGGTLGALIAGVPHKIMLTREQIACLLVHMFLCTLKTPSWNKYWCTFQIWFGSDSKPATEYLQCLLTYFSQLDSTGKPRNPHEKVHFERCVLTTNLKWSQSVSCFTGDILTVTHSVQPKPGCNVEVSFANKDVGFGVSGTQEEIKMGMSPEACVVMLLAPTLQDNETLLIHGVRQVGEYDGIGRFLRFVGSFQEERDWTTRCILAMDAIELDSLGEKEIYQLRKDLLLRELNKAYCGFSSCEQKVIATGHWGCGAFGGDKHVKVLIQLMAACEANKRLVFHDIAPNSIDTQELLSLVSMFSEKKITVGQLFVAVQQLSRVSNVFGDLKACIAQLQ